jgi:MFS family permease
MTTAGAPQLQKRHVFAVMIGGIVEYYDFVVFTFFAIQIGHTYFPASSEFASLMLSLATFGIGFAARPLGGVVLGAYADRAGRRPAMTLTLVMMGLAITAMALIPSYATIGIAAPILAVTARLVQGFALGGEIAPSMSLLLEGSPQRRRGLWVGFFATYSSAGALVGSSVGLILSYVLSKAALDADGWRIAFLLGALTLPLGVWLRRSLPETYSAPPERDERHGWGHLARHKRILALNLVTVAGGNIGFYILQYTTTYAQNVLHLSARVGFASTVSLNLVGTLALIFAGWLSDKVGRRPVFLWARVAMAVAAVPIFAWIVTERSPTSLLVGLSLLAALHQLGTGAAWVWFAEMLPIEIRGRAYGTVFGLGVALFGGTAQLVVTWLIHVTGSELAPAWYLVGAYVAGSVAGLMLAETAPARVKPEALAAAAI